MPGYIGGSPTQGGSAAIGSAVKVEERKEIEASARHAGGLVNDMLTIIERLETLEMRLFGAQPMDGAEVNATSPTPEGAIHSLNANLESAANRARQIAEIVSRLEKL